jgi:hypothetical protein
MNNFELNAPVGGSGNRKIAPEGMHIARCYQIIDLGTSEQGGQFPGKKRKINFVWELPEEMEIFDPEKGQQPFIVKAQYTLSFNEKSSLRKCVESWIGKKMDDQQAAKFNIGLLLGKPCMLNIVHNKKGDNIYANISAITPLAKGVTCPESFNKPIAFNVNIPDMEIFKLLPQFIQDKIKESDEFIKYMENSMNKNDESNFFNVNSDNDLPW